MFDGKRQFQSIVRKNTCLAKRRSVGVFLLLDQRNCKRFDNTVLCQPIAEELQMQSTRAPRNRQLRNLSWSWDQGLATVAQGVNWESSTNALQDQGTIGKTQRHQNWSAICGFTLKIDNEIVERTKHRDHTHARVCSRFLLSTRKTDCLRKNPK